MDPCLNYTILSAEKRSPSYCSKSDEHQFCDIKLDVKWYRINSTAGTDITQTPPADLCLCNTLFPIWMRDPIPSVSDGIVDRQVCRIGANDSCEETMTIKVKNCQTFRVYYLIPTNGCPKAYCFGTNNETASRHCVCPKPGTTGNACTSKTPTCSPTDDESLVWLYVVIPILVIIIIIILYIMYVINFANENESMGHVFLGLFLLDHEVF
uniref:Pancreatic secretory granule membrane major glycoprotein GP2-like n=1 Tax=Crassostrea virginica TaxID=6565 RepID=A0A8B8CXR4_CRAVI|nr:pancreatic secretory granule membrane major glycoprotein GP2-like [Crassostrea virginica]